MRITRSIGHTGTLGGFPNPPATTPNHPTKADLRGDPGLGKAQLRARRTFARWAILAGLALSGSGCIVDEEGPGSGICTPDLYVNWEVTAVVKGVSDTPVTCDSVGATLVSGIVGDRSDSVPCPVGVSQSAPLYFRLPRTGYYYPDIRLVDGGGNTLSELGAAGSGPYIFVDCSGNTQTPVISLSVN